MKAACTILLLCCMQCYGQPYTARQYAVTKDSAVFVGTAFNYCGRTDTITVNIYKPIGDAK